MNEIGLKKKLSTKTYHKTGLFLVISLLGINYLLYAFFDVVVLKTPIRLFVMLVLLVIYCFTGKPQIGRAARTVLCVCAVISLGPLAFGISYFSVTGALITASLIAELLLLHLAMKAPKAKPTE